MTRMRKSDWVVLPAVALVTALVLLAGAEIGARILMPEQTIERCQTPSGASRPNCSFELKAAEGPAVTMAFNDCGSRSIHPCNAAPAGNRVVVVGSSVIRGYGVRYRDMFAPRAEALLDRVCVAPVEFQDLSVNWPTGPDDAAWRYDGTAADKAASLHPKAVLLFVTQWDMYTYQEPASWPPPRRIEAMLLPRALSALIDKAETFIALKLNHVRDTSRLVFAMRSFLGRSDPSYLKFYGRGSDLADYLRPVVTPAWNSRVAMLTRFAEPLAAAAARAGARFGVVYVAPEPPVLLAKHLAADPEDDAFALSRALKAAVTARGWDFIDTLPAFAMQGTPRLEFYRINGHPNAAGHMAIARAITDDLEHDPALCALKPSSSQAASDAGPVGRSADARTIRISN